MIRKSSFGVDGYVPLADRAFALWRELEEASGTSLLRMTGEVWLLHEAGNPEYRAGVEYSIAQGFRTVLDERDLAERFPGFRLYEGVTALYEQEAGFLRSELGIVTQVEQAPETPEPPLFARSRDPEQDPDAYIETQARPLPMRVAEFRPLAEYRKQMEKLYGK